MTVTIASKAEEIFLSSKETQILRQRILLLLLNLIKQDYRDFYTNCAWGVPLWTAELVGLLKQNNPEIALHLALPHERQDVMWKDSMKKRYLKVKLQADTVTYVSTPEDGFSFRKTAEFMTNQSDLLLFYGNQGYFTYPFRNRMDIIEILARKKHIPIRYI